MHPYSYGYHTVEELIRHQPHKIERIYISSEGSESRLKRLRHLAEKQNVAVSVSSKNELDNMVSGQHQGVVARLSSHSPAGRSLETLLDGLGNDALLVVLDQVQDPHNLGACLRSCEAFGAHAVIAPKRQSAGLTPAARKIASGAADVLPFFQVTNLTRVLKWLKSNGLWVVGTCEQASATLFDWDFTQPTVMVLGSESSGMRRLTRENCDQTVQIPTRGRINSLNVSVACGICLFEAGRQRYHC